MTGSTYSAGHALHIAGYFFIALHLFGLIGTTLTLVAARLSPVPRQAAWYSFIASWTLATISWLLSFFAGQIRNPHPGYHLCMVQSAMTFGAAPLCTATTLGLTAQLYLNARMEPLRNSLNRTIVISILVVPWLVFFTLLVAALVIALQEADPVFTTIGYCSLDNETLTRVTYAIELFFLASVLILNVVVYQRVRKTISAHRELAIRPPTLQQTRSLSIRMLIFTCVCTFGLVTVVMYMAFAHLPPEQLDEVYKVLNMCIAALPTSVVLIFGTHKDLLLVYAFWSRSDQASVHSDVHLEDCRCVTKQASFCSDNYSPS